MQHTRNNTVFFENCIVLNFWNDVMAEFNESFLIKLLEEIHIYDPIDTIDINEDKINHMHYEFLHSQLTLELLSSRFNLKFKAYIIIFCNLYPALEESN